MNSSRRFEDLKDELISLKEKIRIHLRRNANEFTLTKLFIDGDNLMQAMKLEVEKCPAQYQREMNSRLFAVTNEWNAFRGTARRPVLIGYGTSMTTGAGGQNTTVPMTTSAILAEGIEYLERTGQAVTRAEVAARETEEIGTTVIDELGSQREALLRTRSRLTDANQELRKSHRIIRTINRTVVTNKCLLMCIIALEIGILVAVVYLRFIHKHK